MSLYPIPDAKVPVILRMVFASRRSREVWQGRMVAAENLIKDGELRSVATGLRQGALIEADKEHVRVLERRFRYYGLRTIVVGEGEGLPGYPMEWRLGGSSILLTVARTQTDAEALTEAVRAEQRAEALQAMGTPACCTARYAARRSTFDGMIFYDTFPLMGVEDDPTRNEVDISPDPLLNPALAYAGLYVLPFVPCRLECPAATAMADQWFALLKEEDAETAESLKTLLSFPCRYTPLHGVAELVHPIFRLMVHTVPTYYATVIRVHPKVEDPDRLYLLDGVATGFSFPFRTQHEIQALRHRDNLGRPTEPIAPKPEEGERRDS